MGKKDATMSRGAPVDQYRKNIGKHDKKDKSVANKEMKQRSEAKKSAMTIQDVMLLLGTFLVLIASVYFFFYVSLSSTDSSKQPPDGDTNR